MVEASKEALRWRKEIDMLEVKKKYGLYCSMDDDVSEASISIAYERLKNSFEDESESSVSTQKFKDMLSVKHKYNIFDDEVSEISASIAYQRMINSTSETSSRLSIKKKSKSEKTGRPYKVCSSRHTERKGIVANSFEELVNKAKMKLTDEKVGKNFTLVLFDDDTEVDDEEYFQTLPDNTVFVLVQRGKVKEKPRSKSVEVKRQLPRRDSSKEGLRELSKLLALDGAVVGKGEIIERNHIRKPLKLDSITQADSFCIDFEIKQKSIDDEDEEAAKKRIDFAYSKNMVAQVIEKLETHKKTLRRDSNFELSVDKKVLRREENLENGTEKKPHRTEEKVERAIDKRLQMGKGDTIERNSITKPLKLNSITQADSFSIDFEIKQQSLEDEDEEATKKRIDFAYSKNMVAQLIDKLETRKKTLQRNTNFELSVDKKVLKREEKVELGVDKKLLKKEDNIRNSVDKKFLKREENISRKADKKLLKREDHFEISVDKNLLRRENNFEKNLLQREQKIEIDKKLLQREEINDISFDVNFRPIHR